MKVIQSILLLLAIFCHISASAALKEGVKVQVEVAPMGDFDILSRKIEGEIYKQGNSFVSRQLSVEVKTLTTGNDFKDSHMLKRFDQKKHPRILINDARASGENGEAEIVINGIKKKIKFRLEEVDSQFVAINFSLSLADFSFRDLRFMGAGVKDKIEVNAILDYKKQ